MPSRVLLLYSMLVCYTLLELKPGPEHPIYHVAGAETTSATVEAAILHMVLFPEAAKKAQAELDAVIGKKRLPMLGDRPDVPYVTAFCMVRFSYTAYRPHNSIGFQEVMRYAAVVPLGR